MASSYLSPVRLGGLVRAAIPITLLFALIAGVAIAFALPWIGQPVPGGSLAHYAPVRDGEARLSAKYDRDGKLLTWRSENIRVIPGQRALASELREASRDAIQKFYGAELQTDDLSELSLAMAARQVFVTEIRTRELDQTNALTETVSVFLRDPRGEFQVSFFDATAGVELVLDPPLRTYASDLAVGSSWESKGTVGTTGYSSSARVIEIASHKNERGSFDDCRKIESRLVFTNEGQPPFEQQGLTWLCAGQGVVEDHLLDADKRLSTRTVPLADDRRSSAPAAADRQFPLPAVEAATAPHAPAVAQGAGDPSTWKMTRLGRTVGNNTSAENTTRPTWIPGEPPALLVANSEGDLVAFDASDATGSVLWRFHTGGPIFGSPAYDPARGRIYFGSSDKRLYALDRRGLFLWSFATGDNVVSRPLVVDDVVIFGSEDRTIYGVDAQTGALRWQRMTGGAVVSSAALAGELVVIGSDDGGVYGLDPRSGAQHWLYVTGAAIEAPVIAEGDTVFVASRDESLYALDAKSGEERWSTAMPNPGANLSTAPLVIGDLSVVVDRLGYLNAFDRASGKLRWSTVEQLYVGPPVAMEDRILVAGVDGKLYRFGLDGKREAEWEAAAARSPGDGEPSFDFGPAVGGGAVWLADDKAVVRRLGQPVAVGPRQLALSWLEVSYNNPPFRMQNLTVTPASYGEQAVVVDQGRNVYLSNVEDGSSVHLGTFGEEGVVFVDPVVAGDTLLTIAGNMLYATHLPDGKPLWQAPSNGTSYRPPVVAKDTVLWISQEGEESCGGKKNGALATTKGTLQALDLATGEPRWQASLEDLLCAGGVVVHGDVVYTSTPPAAFDLATGQLRWRAAITELTLGGAAVNEAGDTLYVGTVARNDAEGGILALNTVDGSERWHSSLGARTLNLLEAPLPQGQILIIPTLTDKGTLVGLDPQRGTEQWSFNPPAPRWGAVAAAEGAAWFILENGQVLALDANSGEPTARSNDLGISLQVVPAFAQRPLVVGQRIIVPAGLALIGLEDEK